MPAFMVLSIIALLLWPKLRPPQPVAPVAPVTLQLSGIGDTIEVSWSALPSNADHASLAVRDGDALTEINLSRDQLNVGRASYVRHTADVSFDMTIYAASGATSQSIAHLVLQPVASATQSPDTSRLSDERAELQNQVQDLKKELQAQRAKSDRLTDLVRILENRLGIEAGEDKK